MGDYVSDISPHAKRQFLGVVRPTESNGVRSKRDHSILNNGTTCDPAFCKKFFGHLL